MMLARNISNCLIKIRAKIGEKSNPPKAGINFLIGANNLSDISSIIFKIGFGLLGATQLRITAPIIEKKNIVRVVFITSITETTPKT